LRHDKGNEPKVRLRHPLVQMHFHKVGDLKEKIPTFPGGFVVWDLGVLKYLAIYPL
jgi:hypothetical protein